MKFPKLYRVERSPSVDEVEDIPDKVETELERIGLSKKLEHGAEIAITAGSRGITNIPVVLKAVVDFVKTHGTKPFILPSMGSHGGATSSGQVKVIESLGITEEELGCPIRSSVEVVNVGETSKGTPVFIDRIASKSDGVIVVNRVKPHTLYEGDIESGLCKMMVIGMGNQKGAQTAHEWSLKWRLKNMIPEIAEEILKQIPVLGGLALVENFYDRLGIIYGVKPSEFIAKEKELLKRAYEITPLLPFEEIDAMVIDEMGKNISGEGIDPNVIGRRVFEAEPPPEKPDVTRIFVRSLSEESHGNAIGVGLADFVHQRIVDDMRRKPTYINASTAKAPRDARLPMVAKSDREGLKYTMGTIAPFNLDEVKVLWVKNTAELDTFLASRALLEEVEGDKDIEIKKEGISMKFDKDNNIKKELFKLPQPSE